MKKHTKLIITILAIITWLFLIFYLSNMDNTKSNNNSKSAIEEVVEITLKTAYQLNITNNPPTQSQIEAITEQLNYPLRKVMHMSVYFILNILIILFIINIKPQHPIKKTIPLAIIICFLYALTDEYHQTLINGRTGQISDVIIDTIGALLGSIFYLLITKITTKDNQFITSSDIKNQQMQAKICLKPNKIPKKH